MNTYIYSIPLSTRHKKFFINHIIRSALCLYFLYTSLLLHRSTTHQANFLAFSTTNYISVQLSMFIYYTLYQPSIYLPYTRLTLDYHIPCYTPDQLSSTPHTRPGHPLPLPHTRPFKTQFNTNQTRTQPILPQLKSRPRACVEIQNNCLFNIMENEFYLFT